MCPCVWSQSKWEVSASKRKSTYTDTHLFIVSYAGKLVLYFFVYAKVRVTLNFFFFFKLVVQFKVYVSSAL